MNDPIGGRSSATPRRGDTNTPTASQGSALQRKHPAHFPAVETGFRSIIIFVTVCTKGRRPLLANASAAALIVESWTVKELDLVLEELRDARLAKP